MQIMAFERRLLQKQHVAFAKTRVWCLSQQGQPTEITF